MTGRGHKADLWGLSIVLFLDLGACVHVMKIDQAVHVHVHFPVGMLCLSLNHVLTSKESLLHFLPLSGP